jgi:CheY-like chemotaxis protein
LVGHVPIKQNGTTMSNAHALIIDDNAQNLEVLGRLLTANGVSYTAVQDTNSLDHILGSESHIDVVFLDIEMPRRNGYEILGLLRQNYGSALRIVACTVHTNEISTAREIGFDGFLAKPLNPTIFAAQLSQILDGTPVWDAS